MINFLAEIAERMDTTILPTPSNQHHSAATNSGIRGIIYEIDISNPPTDSYWLDWGGHFNHFRGEDIMIRYGNYLAVADSIGNMRGMLNSLYVQGRTVFINIPRHPWLFPDYETSFDKIIPFLSNALNPANPSNNVLGEATRAEVRLGIPNFTVKLSDNIAGMTLNQGFSITLHNDDGFFDDEEWMNIFNTPLRLSKSFSGGGFRRIRDGLVENKNTAFDGVRISVADRFRALGDPVYDVINQADFEGVPIRDRALNRPIPIVFGTARTGLIKLTDNRPDENSPGVAVNYYMTAENAASINAVFDRDGNRLDFTFNGNTKIIAVRNIVEDDREVGIEATEALVTGNAGNGVNGNRIGHVIRWLFENKAGVVFNETNFNVGEYNAYANGSFQVNMAVTGGNIRSAIEDVLKNDMAFLIQQTDGRFTLRSYARRGTYGLHVIPKEMITQKPEKDYGRAQDNWFNSCIVEWVNNGGETISELYDARANEAERRYRRRVQKTFETNLTTAANAGTLAGVLSDRYTNMRQVIKLSVGINTAGFQLLDRVRVDLNINDRKFSRSTDFVITAINHSQDILTLEEI